MAPLLLVLLAQTAVGPPEPASGQGLSWFAHTAGESRMSAVVPALEQILAMPPSSIDRHDVVIEHVLDALIRLDADTDADLIVAASSTASYQARQIALVLLARHPERNAGAILELFDLGLEYGASIGAANLLIEHVSPGIASRFLRGLQVEVRINVQDPHHGYSFGASVGCGGGFGMHGFSSSWPPRVRYEFLVGETAENAEAEESGAPAKLFASGPPKYAVYVRREEGYRYGPHPFVWGPEHSLDYLAYLSGLTREQIDLESESTESIVWRPEGGNALVRNRVDEIERSIASRYAVLTERIRDDGWIRDSQREKLDYSIVIRDLRSDQSTALPTFENPHVR